MKFLLKTSNALILGAVLGLAACGSPDATKDNVPEIVAPAPTLQSFIDHTRRDDERLRDQFRNPKETLEFFGLAEGQTVIEIWPGWYTNIIAPYLAANDGTYVAALYPKGIREGLDKRIAAYEMAYADETVYGNIEIASFWKDQGLSVDPETADLVLTFRNTHSWMRDGYADQAFEAFFVALKPGGTLGVVQHRLPETALQDPRGATGYVQESYIKTLAKEAGFDFVAASEINANIRDTADHPMGVWTLPPSSRMPKAGSEKAVGFEADLYKNIGESDRATLMFRKPGVE